jgi:AraC-like DNA-binding protein
MFAELPVPDSVRGSVASIWTYTGRGALHRVLPDGCLDFIFNLGTGSATVVGPMSRAILVPVRAGMTSFGVRFRPGHAARFIDAHARELLDGQGSIRTLTRVSELAERIAEARTHAARSAEVTRALLDSRARIRAPDGRVEHAVRLLQRTHGGISVGELAERVGLGERQLERRFHERVGLGPKRLARVLRFEHALELQTQSGSQAEVAARAGYSDEPHLLREFQVLSGLTPRALARELARERAQDVGFVQGEARERELASAQ